MITMDTGALPPAVAALLTERVAPVIEADARATVRPRMLAEARAVRDRLIRDGYSSPHYTIGMDRALDASFGSAVSAEIGYQRQAAVAEAAPQAGCDCDDCRRARGEDGRTCECNECTDDACQGECDTCDDHDCQQCYRDHDAYSCCGYCPECESHMGDSRDEVCNLGHCHECEHNCDSC